jgi:hypothetical protein
LELAQVVVRDLHLGREPGGHGAGGESFAFHGFGIGREALVHGEGVFEAFLRRVFRIEPRKPAVVDEDGVADQAFGRGLQIAVPFEVETQGGVGTLVGVDRGDDLRGVVEDGLVGCGGLGEGDARTR